MKKAFVFLITLSMLFASLPFSAIADEEQYIFELSEDGTYYILKDVGVGVKDAVIPDEYNGLPVCQVGDTTVEAGIDGYFWDMPFYNSRDTIETITLNENVYKLNYINHSDYILRLNHLKYNEYENGLYLGTKDNPYYAFMNTAKDDITELALHPDTEIIAPYASTSYNLNRVTLSDSLKYINWDAFSVYDSSYNIHITPCDLEYTEYGGFYYLGSETNPYYVLVSITNHDATNVVIHEDTKIILPRSFYCGESKEAATRLESITIPESVITIQGNPFKDVTGLKEINFEADSIDDFEIIEESFELPEGVTVNWGYGKEAEEAPEESAPSTSDEGDGNGNTIIWVICGVAALAVITVALIRRKK